VRDTKRTRAVVPAPRAASYTATKAQWEAVIAPWARRHFSPWCEPVMIWFTWREGDAHRDPDGVSSGGRKLVLDGLVKAGILASDGARRIRGFVDNFEYPGQGRLPFRVGVDVMICGDEPPNKNQRAFFPYRMPDLNELLALRESSARRSVKRSLRGRLV